TPVNRFAANRNAKLASDYLNYQSSVLSGLKTKINFFNKNKKYLSLGNAGIYTWVLCPLSVATDSRRGVIYHAPTTGNKHPGGRAIPSSMDVSLLVRFLLAVASVLGDRILRDRSVESPIHP
ncbi:MAG TPA: hypothetical protein V6C90_20000, partial [Coleofasciculaceae cyanobacterium]